MVYLPNKIDLHMHTIVSDGTDKPEDMIKIAESSGINLFSVTDHDAIKAGKIIKKIIKITDPRFITGVEFSCKDEEGKYHILGYDYDPNGESINELVRLGHEMRIQKVIERLNFIKNEFGFEFSKDDVDQIFSLDNPGKPHIANLMVKYGYASSRSEAITQFIDKKKFSNEYISPEKAIRGIILSGGIPVLAHPFYGDGDDLILGDDMEKRLLRLKGFGLEGVETFYSGFTEKLRLQMLSFAEKYDFMITCGSDYHGSNKMVVAGDTGFDQTMPYPRGLSRFLERVGYVLR